MPYRSFIYGPVCIDRLRRGRGVLRGLFEMLRREVTKHYEVGVAFVSPEILERLRGWRWGAALFPLPGMGRLTPRLYRWVARHWYRFLSALSEDRSKTP